MSEQIMIFFKTDYERETFREIITSFGGSIGAVDYTDKVIYFSNDDFQQVFNTAFKCGQYRANGDLVREYIKKPS